MNLQKNSLPLHFIYQKQIQILSTTYKYDKKRNNRRRKIKNLI